MNLLTDDIPKLRAAFDLIEGDRFFDKSLRELSDYGILHAIGAVLRARREAAKFATEKFDLVGTDWSQAYTAAKRASGNICIIYGSDG